MAEARALEALKPKKETKFIEKLTGKMLRPQTAVAADKSSFIVRRELSTLGLYWCQSANYLIQQVTKPQKPRTQENKTARMPQNELLDLIYSCFRRYKYWPFRSLKAELKQPETYLKQTLEIVAHLVKSGDFAMTWELKPEARESNYADALAYRDAKEELPPTAGYSFDDGSEGEPTASGMGSDNDEDVKFEDVA